MSHAQTIEIGGHTYEIAGQGDVLVAERYEHEGVELRIEGVTSDLTQPVSAAFVRVGPRRGVNVLPMRWTQSTLTGWRAFFRDAEDHLALVERYRREKWGSAQA